MNTKMKFGVEYYRLCSCGTKLKNRVSITVHRQKGHEVSMIRHNIGDVML